MRQLTFARLQGDVGNFKTQQDDDGPVKQLDIEIREIKTKPSHGPSKSKGGEGKLERLIPSIHAKDLNISGLGQNQKQQRK